MEWNDESAIDLTKVPGICGFFDGVAVTRYVVLALRFRSSFRGRSGLRGTKNAHAD